MGLWTDSTHDMGQSLAPRVQDALPHATLHGVSLGHMLHAAPVPDQLCTLLPRHSQIRQCQNLHTGLMRHYATCSVLCAWSPVPSAACVASPAPHASVPGFSLPLVPGCTPCRTQHRESGAQLAFSAPPYWTCVLVLACMGDLEPDLEPAPRPLCCGAGMCCMWSTSWAQDCEHCRTQHRGVGPNPPTLI